MAATSPTETTPGPPPINSSPPSPSHPDNTQLQDPNMANPRLLVNRACIYERQLPGDAYITAHVQRLQHGFYSSTAVSDKDAEHVDFLAISFVLHSPHTLSHRFKSATIRASIHGSREVSTSAMYPHGYPPGNPRFLMHAPHLIYGTVSPETMEWTFSLAGSLGISETPFSASVIPSGSMNGQYRRYEMMRIQGSARTLKSDLGPEFDVEAGEIVWSLEENNLQRSGLPREFTFVMLIQKPTADNRVMLSIDIEPVIQTWFGSYPGWYLSLPAFRPKLRRGVDFRQETGQRFEPVDKTGRFNFAALESSFDDYIAMPGRKYSRQIQIPPDNSNSLTPINNSLQQNYPQNYPQNYQCQYGMNMNPMQMLLNNSISAQNSFAETQLRRLHAQTLPFGNMSSTASSNMATNTNANSNAAAPVTTSTAQTGSALMPEANTINIRLLLDHATASNIANMRVQSPRPLRGQSPQTSRPTPATTTAPVGGPAYRPETTLRRTRSREYLNAGFSSGANINANTNTSTAASFRMRDAANSSLRELKDDDADEKVEDKRDLGVQSPGGRSRARANGIHRVMTMANQPLTASVLAALAEH